MTQTISFAADIVLRPFDLSAHPIFRRRVQSILENGKRSAGELLAELIARDPEFGLKRLKAYASLSRELLAAVDGERFPSLPTLRLVPNQHPEDHEHNSWTRLGSAVAPVINRLKAARAGDGDAG